MNNAIVAILLGSLIAIIVIVIVFWVVEFIAYWKIFQKAGEPGWKSLIPFYNSYIQYKISWSGLWFWVSLACSVVGSLMTGSTGAVLVIGYILTIVALIVRLVELYKLSCSFGHGVGYTIGLFFLHPIFLIILGYGKSEYKGKQ